MVIHIVGYDFSCILNSYQLNIFYFKHERIENISLFFILEKYGKNKRKRISDFENI